MRFSPSGDKLAFVDHATLGDDHGFVDVIDLQGNRKALAQEYSSVQGLVWTPDGSEIWFPAAMASEPRSPRGVDLRGRQRTPLSTPARPRLHDISKDQDVLLTVDKLRDQQLLDDIPQRETGTSAHFHTKPHRPFRAMVERC